MSEVVNHFVHRSAAERYARHRPFFHPLVIARIRERLQLASPLPRTLDVGCGSGHSAVALRAIADRVFATDASAAMLAAAPPADGISYLRAPAEALPFGAAEFPLLTVSMAFHWFDRPRFLAEAARVLVPGGWLVLYGHNHSERLAADPDFAAWRDTYHRRYPRTARHGTPVSDADLAPHGLVLRERSEFSDPIRYTAADFARYLMTHSNVIQVVDAGRESADSAETWIRDSLQPLFRDGATREFPFDGWISWIQKPAG